MFVCESNSKENRLACLLQKNLRKLCQTNKKVMGLLFRNRSRIPNCHESFLAIISILVRLFVVTIGVIFKILIRSLVQDSEDDLTYRKLALKLRFLPFI